MKRLFYALYALFFNISRLFPVKDNRVALVSPHNARFTDSLGEVKSLLEAKGGYDIICITGRDLVLDRSGIGAALKSLCRAIGFFTLGASRLARSHYIFLNDNFMPMASLHFSKRAVITQLWHASGAFKKFGLSLDLPEDIRRREAKGTARLSYVVCSSRSVVPAYAEAFGVGEQKVLPLGCARADKLLRPCDLTALRAKFDALYPECRGKSLVLYAPTFRDNPAADRRLCEHLDAAAFNAEFGETHCLLMRLHPQIHSCGVCRGAVDVTDYPDSGELVQLCDLLITDYSSICMDFALLCKPCVFFAFDLEEYIESRPFYFDYEGYVPGRVVRDLPGLLDAIKNPLCEQEKLLRFREFNFGYAQGDAAERIYNYIIKASS